MARIVNSHHHFWDPDAGDYGWLSGPFLPIRRVFGPEDLRPALERNGVAGTVLVQTWNDVAETEAFLRLAADVDFVWGVVGWVDLTDRDVGRKLERLKSGHGGDRLVAIRHLIQTEADPNWLLRDDVARGLEALQAHGLAYDLVPNLPQLPACIETARRFPKLRFVLDHIAKPSIRTRQFDEWATLLRQFEPEREHVWCKLSGMVTEADWRNWRADDLKPYVGEALKTFGPRRCMYGSDWPVCLVAADYDRVIGALRECLAGLGEDEREQIFCKSAAEAYGLVAKSGAFRDDRRAEAATREEARR